MIIDGKHYRGTVNSYFTWNTIVAQGTWVKKATLNIGTKLTIRKPFFKIVYGQNPTQEGTEMTFSFYDLGSFTPYGFIWCNVQIQVGDWIKVVYAGQKNVRGDKDQYKLHHTEKLEWRDKKQYSGILHTFSSSAVWITGISIKGYCGEGDSPGWLCPGDQFHIHRRYKRACPYGVGDVRGT